MPMFMNAWMMLVLMKCRCQLQSLTLGCYTWHPRGMLDPLLVICPVVEVGWEECLGTIDHEERRVADGSVRSCP